jgi:hypothetical protein
MSSEKIEAFWQDATADDVARVMAGETVEARFRDSETQPWGDCYTLTGWVNELRHQWRSAEAGGRWNFCQVYREPSWFTDKPDPGPGWRLLGKFPDEELKPGDEAWHLWDDKQWSESESANGGGNQVSGTWYRRRIEPVEPVEKKPLLIRRWTVDPGDEIKLPNGRILVISQDGFEVTQ